MFGDKLSEQLKRLISINSEDHQAVVNDAAADYEASTQLVDSAEYELETLKRTLSELAPAE